MLLKKIAVFNCNGIGDVILSTPILKSLHDTYPDSKITFVVRPIVKDVVAGLSFIDNVVTYEKGQPIWPVIRQIWRYDIALCLDFKYRSAVMPFLAMVPIRAGLKHKRGLFMTHAVPRDPNEEAIYEPYNFANIIRNSIGIAINGDLTKLYVSPATQQEQENVDNLFKSITPAGKVVAIAPFTSAEHKDWPISYYQGLIDKLTAAGDCKVVVLGAANDAAKANFVNATNWVGRTSLAGMAEVLRRCSLFVGNCSGPLHIAAAVGVPIVAIYGSTSAKHWAPRNNTIVIQRNLQCSPCDGRNIRCNDHVCLNSIPVEEVFSACQKFLVL